VEVITPKKGVSRLKIRQRVQLCLLPHSDMDLTFRSVMSEYAFCCFCKKNLNSREVIHRSSYIYSENVKEILQRFHILSILQLHPPGECNSRSLWLDVPLLANYINYTGKLF